MELTIEDIKTLESMFIVEMHAAERILRLIESGMEKIYRESKDYKRLVKKMGKDVATMLAQKEHEQAERWAGHHLYKELKWDASKSPFANLKEL